MARPSGSFYGSYAGSVAPQVATSFDKTISQTHQDTILETAPEEQLPKVVGDANSDKLQTELA
jgi:hypothetical protein